MRLMTSPCCSRLPCDILTRKTSTPARISERRLSSVSEAGPTVATILALRITNSKDRGNTNFHSVCQRLDERLFPLRRFVNSDGCGIADNATISERNLPVSHRREFAVVGN